MVKRAVSAATRMKIARSLRGNKNAYRGGPKARLTARQKVANINARTSAKRPQLSQAQLELRKKVAMRLRRQARAEEAGIKPSASKPLPTPTSVKKDPDVKEAAARAKNKLPTSPNYRALGTPELRKRQDLLATRYLDMHGDSGLNKKIRQLEQRKRLSIKEQAQLGALQRLSDTRRAKQRVDGVPDRVTQVSEPRAVRRVTSDPKPLIPTTPEGFRQAILGELRNAATRAAANGWNGEGVKNKAEHRASKSTKAAQSRGRKVQ